MNINRLIEEEKQNVEFLKERFKPKDAWRPHLFMPKQYWLLECTGWVLFGWFIVILGWFEGW